MLTRRFTEINKYEFFYKIKKLNFSLFKVVRDAKTPWAIDVFENHLYWASKSILIEMIFYFISEQYYSI